MNLLYTVVRSSNPSLIKPRKDTIHFKGSRHQNQSEEEGEEPRVEAGRVSVGPGPQSGRGTQGGGGQGQVEGHEGLQERVLHGGGEGGRQLSVETEAWVGREHAAVSSDVAEVQNGQEEGEESV